MRSASSISILVLTIASLLTPALARQAPVSYCKCICFQNSTIIPMNTPPDQKPPTSDPDSDADSSTHSRPRALSQDTFAHQALGGLSLFDRDDENTSDGEGSGNKHHRTLTCADCNRAFCRDYNLPICKGAKEEDIFTSCFRRDSVKDETVVFLFILLTTSLLSWAVLKPWINKFRGLSSASAYAPIVSSNTPNGGRGARAGGPGDLLPGTDDSYRDQNTNSRNRVDSGSIARQGGLNS